MKKIIFLIIIIIIAGYFLFFNKDTYVGFYYPNASNLTNNIQSKISYDSLDACREWVNEQISIYNPTDSNYDYECGKNCDVSGSEPYICEETLE